MDRRDFLRVGAGGVVAATLGACSSSGGRSREQDEGTNSQKAKQPTLRIAQWSAAAAGLPGYDEWFDDEYTQRWGQDHDVQVTVEHFRLAELAGRAEADVAAQGGHDIFTFTNPPPAFEDHVIDHRDMVEEAQAKLGKMTPFAERSVLNPMTGKYFGFPEFWAALPAHYRTDLWDRAEAGIRPATWEDVLRVAPDLNAAGHPVGIGLSEDPESTWTLLGLMHAYGSSIQDEAANLVINKAGTVEAVKLGRALVEAGMDDDVFGWDAVANNRFLASGRGSLIVNGVSALRAIELQDPELAPKIGLLPSLAGPAGASTSYLMGVAVIWNFSTNIDLAQRFLIDLALDYREAFLKSQFYKLPAFPGSVRDLPEVVAADPHAQPPGKYGLLDSAAQWTTNLGHPGHANPAVDEVFQRHLVPKMFARAARGIMSAEEAVSAAQAEMQPIFDKWRERGKI
jgi:multiple sugar transport system substrate-binding protein